MLDAYTDYPFEELGDTANEKAPIRKCTILTWDRNKYCDVLVYFVFPFRQRKDLVATVFNLGRESKRITEVLTSITTISTAQTKERERVARGLRHDDGHAF